MKSLDTKQPSVSLQNFLNHTMVIVVTERFPKACWLIPLAKCPTAVETAETILSNCFTAIIYQRILCLTDWYNLLLSSERHSLNNLMFPSVFHKVTIQSLMAKWRDSTRRVTDSRNAITSTTRTTGVNTFHGPSMPRIHSATLLQDLSFFPEDSMC